MSETGNIVGTPEPAGTEVPTKSTTVGSPEVLAVLESATLIADLWTHPRIEGLSRSERNATIEEARAALIVAVAALRRSL